MQRIPLFFLPLFFIYGQTAFGQTPPFQWSFEEDEVFQRAKETNTPVIIYYFQAETFDEDKKVWTHPLVTRYGDRFLGLQVLIDFSDTKLADKHDIRKFPSVLFFDPKGRELYSYRYEENDLKRSTLAVRIKRVLDEIETFAMVEAQYEQDNTPPSVLRLYARGLRDRALYDEAEREYQRLFAMNNVNPDILAEARSEHEMMTILKATRHFYAERFDECIGLMDRFQAKYENSQWIDHATFLKGIALYESGERRSGERILNELAQNSRAGVFQENARNYLEQNKGRR